MGNHKAPMSPRGDLPFIDVLNGNLKTEAAQMLVEMHRNTVAGFVSVPCTATTTTNVISLIPTLHEEGAKTYDDGRSYTFKADATSAGAVTAKVLDVKGNALPTLKVYRTNGKTQIGTDDIISGRVYKFTYEESLDTGAGGFVADASGAVVDNLATRTGWTADTGTAKRTANATYSGTASAGYVQAEIQTLMDAVRDLSQTLKALKDDAFSNKIIGS